MIKVSAKTQDEEFLRMIKCAVENVVGSDFCFGKEFPGQNVFDRAQRVTPPEVKSLPAN